ncbi:MAG: iron chelate uptake ABC transporter family permease subunit [Micropruina sp.]|uniref:FecCD family ABC transporter permease n=1 Tax=Micropruina sp. TaxID=2737536 RepID=UPI0039E68491
MPAPTRSPAAVTASGRVRGTTLSRTTVALALTALVLACLASLAVGANPLSPAQVWAGLTGNEQEAIDVVRGGRLPRTVLGLLIGAALGAAGAVMQSITRNPLADPQLLGVNGGAAAAVVTAISVFKITHPGGYVWFALIGAGCAAVLVYLLGTGRRSASNPVRLLLAGTAVQAVLQSYVVATMLTDPTAYYSFRYWDIGALTGRALDEVAPVVWFLVAGLIGMVLLARPLNALSLGDEAGRALGANVFGTRVGSALVIVALCGSATAAVGPIAFVGLAVPHLARLTVGVDHRTMLPASALLGALLLVAADVAGRVIAWPQEVGVGIVTAIVGAPVLIWLVRARRVGRL